MTAGAARGLGVRGAVRALVRVAVLAGVVLAGWGGYAAWVQVSSGGLPASVPSCSWPLRVRGAATSEQAGLIRCYLRALASHDAGGLLAVADGLAGCQTTFPVSTAGCVCVVNDVYRGDSWGSRDAGRWAASPWP